MQFVINGGFWAAMGMITLLVFFMNIILWNLPVKLQTDEKGKHSVYGKIGTVE